LRLGRTPRTSGPEIKSEKYDGYQHNFTSHSMTNKMVAEPFVVRLLSWCVQVHVMYLIVLISQTKEIKAASLLQIRAFEELLSLVLNYFWTIMWSVILPYVTFDYDFGMFTHFSEKRTAMTK
jgi:hypothetical protein